MLDCGKYFYNIYKVTRTVERYNLGTAGVDGHSAITLPYEQGTSHRLYGSIEIRIKCSGRRLVRLELLRIHLQGVCLLLSTYFQQITNASKCSLLLANE